LPIFSPAHIAALTVSPQMPLTGARADKQDLADSIWFADAKHNNYRYLIFDLSAHRFTMS
jgi:hypothetical protein